MSRLESVMGLDGFGSQFALPRVRMNALEERIAGLIALRIARKLGENAEYIIGWPVVWMVVANQKASD